MGDPTRERQGPSGKDVEPASEEMGSLSETLLGIPWLLPSSTFHFATSATQWPSLPGGQLTRAPQKYGPRATEQGCQEMEGAKCKSLAQ